MGDAEIRDKETELAGMRDEVKRIVAAASSRGRERAIGHEIHRRTKRRTTD